MPTPLASRFVHLEIRVDAEDWLAWGAANGIAAEVLFFITYEPDLLHQFDPRSKERAFPCPRTWEFASNIVKHRNGLDPEAERALFRGTVGEAAAVEFAAFLKVWRELPHPRAIVNDPENADIPSNASALMALCGALYKLASDINFDAIVTIIAPHTAMNSSSHFALSFHDPPKAVRNRIQARPATPASCARDTNAPPPVIAATAFRRSTR